MDEKFETVAKELHRPARRNYPRRKFDIRGLDETWQADLVDMQKFARENNGYKYLLTVIDVFSKYAWALPLKQKTGSEVMEAMNTILKAGRTPKNLQVDQGTEFYNAQVKNLLKRYKIHLYSTYSNLKASICERFNRTLKTNMWLQFTLRGKYKWIDILQDLMLKYNNTKHRTIDMKPIDVTRENEANVLKKFPNLKSKRRKIKYKFKVGDFVRISREKHIFEKGYTPSWSTEVFSITRVVRTYPVVTYHLKDYKNEPIAGGFYEQELTKVKYPDIYLVEKILKKRKNEIYVKWLGFDSSHNSWINKNSITIND